MMGKADKLEIGLGRFAPKAMLAEELDGGIHGSLERIIGSGVIFNHRHKLRKRLGCESCCLCRVWWTCPDPGC